MAGGAAHAMPPRSGQRRVCIVTTAIVSDNPRVVKEADALAAAGHLVRVVSSHPRNANDLARDARTIAGKLWVLDTVQTAPAGLLRRAHWVLKTIRQRVARELVRIGVDAPFVVDAAIARNRHTMLRRALEQPADLVIAHHAPALPPAARAAKILGAQLGFDAEDLHAEELPDIPRNALDRRIISVTERRYLPLCERMTASSPGIAEELVRRYDVRMPEIVLNVFPSELLPPRAPALPGAPVSLYWYSQVIGLDRGLQDVLHAMPLVGRAVELHLRGILRDDVRAELTSLAKRLGVADALYFHPVAPPPDLPSLAAEHDIGLALEQPVTMNRQLCITNKLMLYFTAGIAVVATDTPGQRAILEQARGAGTLYAPGDHVALARAIDALIASPEVLAAAQSRSRELGIGRFSWERQAERLVKYLTATSPAPSDQPRSPVQVG